MVVTDLEMDGDGPHHGVEPLPVVDTICEIAQRTQTLWKFFRAWRQMKYASGLVLDDHVVGSRAETPGLGRVLSVSDMMSLCISKTASGVSGWSRQRFSSCMAR